MALQRGQREKQMSVSSAAAVLKSSFSINRDGDGHASERACSSVGEGMVVVDHAAREGVGALKVVQHNGHNALLLSSRQLLGRAGAARCGSTMPGRRWRRLRR